jgi:hypothetical protein
MRAISSLFGLTLFWLMAFGYCRLAAIPIWFFNPQTFIYLVAGVSGTAILAFGTKEFGGVLRSFGYLFSNPKAPIDAQRTVKVIRFMILSCFAQGGILFVIEILSLVKHHSFIITNPSKISHFLVPMMGITFFTLFVSEALLRPLKARLETFDWE